LDKAADLYHNARSGRDNSLAISGPISLEAAGKRFCGAIEHTWRSEVAAIKGETIVNARMTTPYIPLNSIFHPSDFSHASEIAFVHALKLALVARAELSIMHVAPEIVDVEWTDLPGVRSTLARWGLLPEDSPREAVTQLGPRVQKILASGDEPIHAMLRYLDDHPADLVVLATHQREGLARWMHRAIAAPLARRSGTMTLFVPHGVSGFVALADGTLTLQRILIPIDTTPRPQAAVEAASGLARVLGGNQGSFTLVHIGAGGDMPAVDEPRHEGWTWDRVVRQGNVVEQILAVEAASAADLIVLTTQGHHGVLDALRGSTSERLVRGARCPVLAIPAGAG
jgi:nucleotide-binding universal stress UspA family protein